MGYQIWYSPYTNEIRLTFGGRAIELMDTFKDCFFIYSSRRFSKTWVYLGDYYDQHD